MEELVAYIAKALVDDPDAIVVRRLESGRLVAFELRVAPDDTGKVIGKQGRIVNALRQVVKAAGLKTGEKATIDIVS